jgi:hypothetical protein
MFASLLPGLRELRAPLAAGYVWLLGLWLTLLSVPIDPDDSSGLYDQLVGLANWAGKSAIFVASGFVAYLLGVLSNFTIGMAARGRSRLVDAVDRRLERFTGTPIRPVNVNRILSEAVTNRLAERFLEDAVFQDRIVDQVLELQHEHSQREMTRQMYLVRTIEINPRGVQRRLPPYIETPSRHLLTSRALEDYAIRWNIMRVIVDTWQLAEAVRRDLENMAPRLIGREDGIYGEYDRLMSEGTFRTGMFLPMSYLFAVLGLVASSWWFLGLALPVAMLYLGAHSRGLARKQLASAILAGRIESPVLQRVTSAPYVPFAGYDDVIVSIKGATPSGSYRVSRR